MFTVYSKPACPFCDQAKALLSQQGLAYTEVILDVGQTKKDGVKYVTKDELLAVIPSARTMPQIMRGQDLIGGYSDLKRTLMAA